MQIMQITIVYHWSPGPLSLYFSAKTIAANPTVNVSKMMVKLALTRSIPFTKIKHVTNLEWTFDLWNSELLCIANVLEYIGANLDLPEGILLL